MTVSRYLGLAVDLLIFGNCNLLLELIKLLYFYAYWDGQRILCRSSSFFEQVEKIRKMLHLVLKVRRGATKYFKIQLCHFLL